MSGVGVADGVVNQSGAPDGEQSEIKLAFNTYQMLHQSACGSLTPLRPEDCSNSKWVITIKWAEVRRTDHWGVAQTTAEQCTMRGVDATSQATCAVQNVQGHRLKWWGLEELEKQDLMATFNPTEEDTGICFHWDDSEEDVTQEQIESWITATAVCGSV